MITQRKPSSYLFLLLLAGVLASGGVGCGDDGAVGAGPDGRPDVETPDDGDADDGVPLPPDEPPSAPVETLEDQLRELGIDVDAVKAEGRRLDQETEVGEQWAPLGQAPRLAPKEVFLVGAEDAIWRDSDASTPDIPGPRSLFVEMFDEDRGRLAPATTFVRYETGSRAPVLGSRPDNSGVRPGSQATRTAAAADFDGDGREEAMILRARELPDSWAIAGDFIEDDEAFDGSELAFGGFKPIGRSPVRDVAAAAGDVSGDGKPDLLFAFLKDDYFAVHPLPGNGDGTFDQRAGGGTGIIELEPTSGTRSLEMAVGNLDWDPQLETVVLVRTWDDTLDVGEPSGHVRWFLYDDLSTDPLRPTVREEGIVMLPAVGGGNSDAVTADVTLGDFDGDGVDEVAFAGLTRFRFDCAEDDYGVVVLDDLPREMKPVAFGAFAEVKPGCAGGTALPGLVYEVMANALEWDGDHPKELQVNELLLDVEGDEVVTLGSVDALPRASERHFSEASQSIVTADVTKDGLDEVISFSNHDGTLRFRGRARDADGEVAPFAFELPYSAGEERAPVLVPFDNDLDGHSLRYVAGSHRVELSEPIVHAVLAAPPCSAELGQDLDECTTTWGRAQASGSEQSRTTTGTASATVGITVGTGFGPFSFEASYEATVETWTSATTGTAYELTYTIDYTTHGRDAVVFTSIPYDVYEYEIVGSPRADEVGERLAFFFPRRPVTRPVSVRYFNDRVRPGGLLIDERVVSHEWGDPTTYRGADGMREVRAIVEGRQPGDAFAFLSNGPRDVGASQTTVGVSIEVAETNFVEDGQGVSHSHSVSLTGGVVMASVSVGEEESSAIRTSISEATTFSGSVPGVNDDAFGYAFGMFTYIARVTAEDGGVQAFPVIDYWVE